jgi:hypothetical protein
MPIPRNLHGAVDEIAKLIGFFRWHTSDICDPQRYILGQDRPSMRWGFRHAVTLPQPLEAGLGPGELNDGPLEQLVSVETQ